LPSLIIIAALTGGTARAQDLDQGKSGAKLFAANCAGCQQPARPRQGQVQLDAVALPATALHEQPRLGAGAVRPDWTPHTGGAEMGRAHSGNPGR
jgi:hypothetical protein